jgi:putative addiction module component (TIGR02574 family)
VSAEREPEDEDFTDEQKAEIDRRLAAYEATGRTETWDEFLSGARARWDREVHP